MATPTAADQRRISAHQHSPSRSSGAANSGTARLDTVQYLDVDAPSSAGSINIRRRDFAVTADPTTSPAVIAEAIPDPRIGDRLYVFVVDSTKADNPCDYWEYHYKPLGTNPAAWRRVQYVGA